MPRSPRVAERRGQRRAQSNPPFHPHILSLPGVAGVKGGLKRGKLKSMDPGAAVGWTLRFLYNPSTITLQHGLDSNSLAPGDEPAGDLSAYYGQTFTTVAWSLLFDRTYETWDKGYRDKPAGKYGVYADIRALYGMLGMVNQRPINGLDLITGPMQFRLAQVYFGGERSLSYFGRIESVSVDYTHWTTKMIPNRAVVGLTMAVYPKLPVDAGGGGGGGGGSRGGKKPGQNGYKTKTGGQRRTVPQGALGAGF